MSALMANYIIPGGGRGGELQGPGFGRGNPPTLTSANPLQVTVQWTGDPGAAPASLTGYFVFTPAQGVTQSAPSPFLVNGFYRCYDTQTANKSSGPGNQIQYLFGGYDYFGGNAGQYELTFVAEIGTGTADAQQWSADPEFETGN